MKNHKLLLGALGLGFFQVSTGCDSQTTNEQRPNVLIIMTDDQGWAQFSAMDHPYLQTPNMDRLMAESVSFSNYLLSPVCAPTRASLMTGRYPYRTGVNDTYMSRVNMFNDEMTIANYLKEAGYATALFGKWHLGYNAPLRPIDQGFDTYAVWEEMQHSRHRPQIEQDGVFTFYEKFLAEVFSGKVVSYIEENKDNPFFVFYPLYLPHLHRDNLQVPAKYSDRFLKYEDMSKHARDIYGMIEKADKEIGKVLDKLDELGLSENTIVVFMSDNGATRMQPQQDAPLENNGGLRGWKGNVYEGGIRSPLFVRFPSELEAGLKVDRMVSVNDILPTILELCDAEPADWVHPIDGKSLVPLLKNPDTPEWPDDRTWFVDFIRGGPEQLRSRIWENSAVRQERFKLVNGSELYDLKNDPGERRNLADQHPDIVKTMRELYVEWFEDVSADRDLKSALRHVGDPKQNPTFLYFFDRDSSGSPTGWPVRILSEGPYTISIENLRHDMFGRNVVCVLRVGDVVMRQPVIRKADMVFEGVKLPTGDHMLDITFEGDVREMMWRYGLPDRGHRLIWVRKE